MNKKKNWLRIGFATAASGFVIFMAANSDFKYGTAVACLSVVFTAATCTWNGYEMGRNAAIKETQFKEHKDNGRFLHRPRSADA